MQDREESSIDEASERRGPIPPPSSRSSHRHKVEGLPDTFSSRQITSEGVVANLRSDTADCTRRPWPNPCCYESPPTQKGLHGLPFVPSCPSAPVLPYGHRARLLLAATADARVFVVRPDGSGDAPTFQAGLDTLKLRLNYYPSSQFDTLLVQPGDYAEDALLSPLAKGLILCPAGPELTKVRSFRSLGSQYFVSRRVDVHGLTVSASTTIRTRVGFRDCHFLGPVDFVLQNLYDPPPYFVRCRLQDRFFYYNQGLIDSCDFRGPVSLRPYEDPIELHACTFAGQDTAAIMFSTYDHAGVNFEECSFRHVHRAIVHLPPSIGWYLHVNACTFQDVEGPLSACRGWA